MKTLKAEQMDGRSYATMEELEQDIGAFLDGYYNLRRLHSSLAIVRRRSSNNSTHPRVRRQR
jgi:hypothetical protein